jgi:hypothetical protein
MAAIHKAVADGPFYPAAPGALRVPFVDRLGGGDAAGDATCVPPKLPISPHAGSAAPSGTSRGAASTDLIARGTGQGDPPWT